MSRPRIFTFAFAKIYPLYIEKATKKGRTKEEVDTVIFWLTGYDAATMQAQIDCGVDMEAFFLQAPCMNPNAELVKGVVCGVRVEDVEDATMRKIRQLDKLVDELAKGWKMEKILRV